MKAIQIGWFGDGFIELDYNELNKQMRRASKGRKNKKGGILHECR